MKQLLAVSVALLIVLLGTSAQAARAERTAAPRPASTRSDIEACRGDVTCVGLILAELIERNGGSDRGTVSFYHSDSCAQGELLRTVSVGISAESCARLGNVITTRVWGVRMDGGCIDISDTDFNTACLRYASE
jgi:hypothetical protein